jgi:MSHA biogenesis protein MshJ
MLVCGLSLAVIYALFSLFLFMPLDAKTAELTAEIKQVKEKIANWQAQSKSLSEIPNTPIFKEWQNIHKNNQTIKEKYKVLLGNPGSDKWEEIIKKILNDYPNITIEKIHNQPESKFQTSQPDQTDSAPIYQDKMQLSVIGSFEDIVNYLISLEKALPNIHWNTLKYTVTEYPQARVEMEFSVLYEKSDA